MFYATIYSMKCILPDDSPHLTCHAKKLHFYFLPRKNRVLAVDVLWGLAPICKASSIHISLF